MDPPMSARSLGSSGRTPLSGTARSLLSAGDVNRSVMTSAEEQDLSTHEALMFPSDAVRERVQQARKMYPGRKELDPSAPDEDGINRRTVGFNLGFQKIFATTSIKLPVTAYTVYAELHSAENAQIYSRVFNGLSTVSDLKKWIFEKMLVPLNAYDLAYAEPGKAALTDQLRLVTMEESMDTRTLATTRAVHREYKGLPGVHSLGDPGVTRLYVRLKCRHCGDLVTNLQTCRKFKTFGNPEAMHQHDFSEHTTQTAGSGFHALMMEERCRSKGDKDSRPDTKLTLDIARPVTEGLSSMARSLNLPPSRHGEPGIVPEIEDCWYRPDEKKHCLFHSRGYEMSQGARAHGHSELARVYLSCGKEPVKKLRVAEQVLSKRGAHTRITY
eukprot:TRINITY_DN15290_c0_g1_i1.p1 TRINITY_DN15290_c0_g1~~TRINITY_DN15290_c0_g1_i1.p1  ORF type:complete len:385 (-),score=63.19 TRINITY_DN15290_c0_g1_i1:153-1307(-)